MKSLKFKLVIFCIVIVFTIDFIFAFTNYYFQSKEMLTKLDQSITQITESTINNITIPVYNLDTESIDKVLKTALSYEALVAATVRSEDGERVLTGKARNPQGHTVNFTSSSENYYQTVTQKLEYKDRTIGFIDLYFTDDQVQDQIQQNTRSIIVMNLLIFLLLIVGLIFFLQSVVIKPLAKIMHIFDSLPEEIGGISASANRLDEPDEIKRLYTLTALITKEINRSYYSLKDSEKKYRLLFDHLLKAVETSDYSKQLTEESATDELTASINKILLTLHQSYLEATTQNWLKSGQTDLNSKISGKQSLNEVAGNAINYIARYIDAQVGVIYLLDETGTGLELAASYAFQERKGFFGKFKIGEGLTGQAAREKKMILFSEIPDDYIFIGSGLGKTIPKFILVYPLLFENEVLGVIELGSVKQFTELQIKFVESVALDIAVTISSASFNMKLQKLLDTTRQQSEELQIKQTEVQKTNVELEKQAEILKINESKLQQQTEELQAMNEELEEKTQMLEEQKEEIETKNDNLSIKQAELERQTRELEQATKYKSEFLANMSHELRTPLNSMLLLAKMMADNEENNLTQEQVESSQSIYRSGQNLLRLINDILDISKIEAKKIELSIGKCRLSELANNISMEFKHTIQEKGLEYEVKIDSGLPEFITTDLLRIEQIVRNFMSNAIKFTDAGSVKLTISRPGPELSIRKPGLTVQNALAISVSDSGIGIPADKQQLIFEAFKQVDGSISRKYGGTGLGMSIAKELAGLIGGEIHLSSQSGQGTTFTLLIPEVLAAVNSKTEPEQRERPPVLFSSKQQKKTEPETAILAGSTEPGAAVATKTIPAPPENGPDILNAEKTMLIIEDDDEFAKVLKAVSEKKGYQCYRANDGENGIKYAIKYKPSAIILDIGLPGIDGWAVMDELKNNSETRHIPVHIMSAYDKSEYGMQKGAIGYFTKPISKEQLDEAFNKIEAVASAKVKELLIVEDDAELRRSIIKLLKSSDVNITAVGSGSEALKELKAKTYNTMILDLGLPDITGFELLDKIVGDEDIPAIPVIVYTGRDLSQEEKDKLKNYTSTVVLKSANSTDKLLDETALFLHRVEKELPQEQQKIIRKMLDKESVLTSKKVLIVDDDMRNAFALSKYLKSKMMIPLIANNGQKALEELDKTGDVDIVLMDIMMPVMDGYEAITKIRAQERFKALPILALTAKAMETDRRKAIECGANDYLTKPVDADKLISLMRIWIYQKN